MLAAKGAVFLAELEKKVANRFRTMGGGKEVFGNPIAAALKDQPAVFCTGVSVRDVTMFIAARTMEFIEENLNDKRQGNTEGTQEGTEGDSRREGSEGALGKDGSNSGGY